MVVIGGVIPPDDVPTLKEMGAAAVFLPGTVIAESALDLLAKLRPTRTARHRAGARSTYRHWSRASATGSAPRCRGRSRWSSPRARTTGPRRASCSTELGVHRTRPAATRVGISGVPGVGKSTFIEALGTQADRRRPPGRRARGRPVVGAHRRLRARRQDPDGAAVRRPGRLHPALAGRRHPRRRRPGHRRRR